jgi:hypothetical protein
MNLLNWKNDYAKEQQLHCIEHSWKSKKYKEKKNVKNVFEKSILSPSFILVILLDPV